MGYINFGLFQEVQDRVCKFCNAVEGRNHFVHKCKLFETRRHSFFSALNINFLTLSCDLKWQMLMGKKSYVSLQNMFRIFFFSKKAIAIGQE